LARSRVSSWIQKPPDYIPSHRGAGIQRDVPDQVILTAILWANELTEHSTSLSIPDRSPSRLVLVRLNWKVQGGCPRGLQEVHRTHQRCPRACLTADNTRQLDEAEARLDTLYINIVTRVVSTSRARRPNGRLVPYGLPQDDVLWTRGHSQTLTDLAYLSQDSQDLGSPQYLSDNPWVSFGLDSIQSPTLLISKIITQAPQRQVLANSLVP
jgi:hypothetical protein